MRVKPVEVILEHRGQILELIRQAFAILHLLGELVKRFGSELVPLQFAQRQAQFLGESRESRAGAKQFQVIALPGQQPAQHHEAAFFVEHLQARRLKLIENEIRQALEGKDMQPRVAGKGRLCQQLPLQAVGCLLGCDQQQRQARRRRRECLAHFRQTTEGLAAARRPQEETDLHG